MAKRWVAAILWFVSVTATIDLVASFGLVPHALAPILGITAAVLVAFDPLDTIWVPRRTATEGATNSGAAPVIPVARPEHA